jgi:hypothetical protein
MVFATPQQMDEGGRRKDENKQQQTAVRLFSSFRLPPSSLRLDHSAFETAPHG